MPKPKRSWITAYGLSTKSTELSTANMDQATAMNNLATLGRFLTTLPPERFSMAWYRHRLSEKNGRQLKVRVPSISTPTDVEIGDVIGWAPTLIPISETDYNDDGCIEYEHYMERVMAMSSVVPEDDGLPFSRVWLWLMHFGWTDIDNHPLNAARRIAYLLERAAAQALDVIPPVTTFYGEWPSKPNYTIYNWDALLDDLPIPADYHRDHFIAALKEFKYGAKMKAQDLSILDTTWS